MSNRSKTLRMRFAPPLSTAGLTAVFLITSASIAPHVANEGFYASFWLGAVSVVTLLGAVIATIATVIFAGISIAEWTEE